MQVKNKQQYNVHVVQRLIDIIYCNYTTGNLLCIMFGIHQYNFHDGVSLAVPV